MSTSEIPDRTIQGLKPRARARASSLVRENRPEPTHEATPELEPEAPTPPPESDTPPTAPLAPASSGGPKNAPRSQLNVDVPPDVRQMARAAYRAAAYFEGTGSFGEFVTKALEAEIRRVQDTHNGGRPLEPIAEKLPTGRQPK